MPTIGRWVRLGRMTGADGCASASMRGVTTSGTKGSLLRATHCRIGQDAEHGLFMVAQRERGVLSFVSVHESIHDAAVDLLSRAARGLRDPRGHVAPLVDILPE